jgi:hypothetical protein
MLFSGKLTAQAFDELVADTFPGVNIVKRSYDEEGNEPGVTHGLFLYYYVGDVKDKHGSTEEHVGTYRREDGECWIFERAFEHPGLEHLR